MRTEQIHYLNTIAHSRSLHEASEKLHLTPQALSLSIRKLEDEVGYSILERTTLGVSLTKEGRALLTAGKRFLAAMTKIKPATGTESPSPTLKGTMTISATSGVAETILPSSLSQLYTDYPQLRLTVKESSFNALLALMTADKSIELGFIYQLFLNDTPITQYDQHFFSYHNLLSGRYYCIAHQKFALTRYKSVSLKTMTKYPIIIYAPTADLTKAILAFGQQNTELIIASNITLYRQLLNSGVGIGLNMLISNFNTPVMPLAQLSLIPLKEKIASNFGYLTRTGYSLSAKGQQLGQYFQQFYQNFSPQWLL